MLMREFFDTPPKKNSAKGLHLVMSSSACRCELLVSECSNAEQNRTMSQTGSYKYMLCYICYATYIGIVLQVILRCLQKHTVIPDTPNPDAV